MAAKRKGAAAAKPLGATLRIKMSNGKTKTYTKKVCGKNRTEAKAIVKKERDAGKLARMKVDPVTKNICIYTAKKAATAKKKR